MFHVKHLEMKVILNLILILLITVSCKTNSIIQESKNGDLIFVESNYKNLSGAISRVTQSDNNTISFDHVILIEKNYNKLYALHASSEKGSVKELLRPLIRKYHKNKQKLVLYRVTEETCRNKAVEKAKKLLGKPYNHLYILNEDSYYCSDFVERAYRECNIFKLEPMTFINPKTRKIDDYWLEFYKKHQQEVPQGKLGCNPNGISHSDKLKKILIY